MRKHTEHPGDGGSLELHHGRLAGDDSVASSAQGFLSLMRTVVAVLGFLVMAWTSGTMPGRPGVPGHRTGDTHTARRCG